MASDSASVAVSRRPAFRSASTSGGMSAIRVAPLRGAVVVMTQASGSRRQITVSRISRSSNSREVGTLYCATRSIPLSGT
ncbi:hypothetical protein D3C71_2068590 [compost metagenome]